MIASTKNQLPRPSKAHAVCAWCRTDFGSIVELIDHVDHTHTPTSAGSAARVARRTGAQR